MREVNNRLKECAYYEFALSHLLQTMSPNCSSLLQPLLLYPPLHLVHVFTLYMGVYVDC